MKILAIETSCDETAAAVVEDGRRVLSSVVHTQIEEHRLYGGVVPEIASRRHTEQINQVVKKALTDAGLALEGIDAVAVTAAPGLIGALLVGVNFAKGLALASGKPLIPVNHLRGHIAANYIAYPTLKPPFLCLVVSGGHTHIIDVADYTHFQVLGRTRDDAAGESFDKVARSIGFPYPGGVHMDKVSGQGNIHAYTFPHPKVEGSAYDMSFSGLKTAVINLVHNASQKGIPLCREDIAASFGHTVASILCEKLFLVQQQTGREQIVAAGGVSANSQLRAMLTAECEKRGLSLYLPPLALCGDNAAMIGAQAYYEYQAGNTADSSLNAMATMSIDRSFAEY